MEEQTSQAIIRGIAAFVAVLLIGGATVFAVDQLQRADDTGSDQTSPSPSVSPTPSPGADRPDAWLAWVPGGLPDGFGPQIASVPAVDTTTTQTADIAWLTASFDAGGTPVDQPEEPLAIPIDTTGVEPAYASYVAPSLRSLITDLGDGEGVLSETGATLRGLGADSTLTFQTGASVTIVGTLPDYYMGGFELLVTRATGETIGVTHERYVLFQVKEGISPSSSALASRFTPYLPVDAPYPVVEVRRPFGTRFLRPHDKETPPMLLKRRLGEFTAIHDPSTGLIQVDPGWIEDHIEARALPPFGTVTCHAKALDQLEGAALELEQQGLVEAVESVGECFDPSVEPNDPRGLLTALDFGASIEINPKANPAGQAPTPETQPSKLVKTMFRWGFGWGGTDAWPQGALFRMRRAVDASA